MTSPSWCRYCPSTNILVILVLSLAGCVDAKYEYYYGPVAGFIPKKLPAIIAIVLYSISAFIHWYYVYKWGKRYMLTLSIGMTCIVIGFILRIFYSKNPFSLTLYSLSSMFILLSPCAFLATDYIILHHMSLTLDPESARDALFISPAKIVKVFVTSDVITFLLQALGGGLSVQQSTVNIGKNITLIALILQMLSFMLFTCLLLYFGWRVDSKYPIIWYPTGAKNMRTLFICTCLTCIGIIIRSVFRVIEYIGGYRSSIAVHEGYFYLLDALPLWLAMAIYCFIWPTRYINGDKAMPIHGEQNHIEAPTLHPQSECEKVNSNSTGK